MGEIVDITTVLPLRHTLVMMASFVLLPHAMRVADKKCPNLLMLAKLDHLSRGFMAQIAHPPFDTTCHLVLRSLPFLPATGVLLAACLFPGKLPVPHVALALETADATA